MAYFVETKRSNCCRWTLVNWWSWTRHPRALYFMFPSRTQCSTHIVITHCQYHFAFVRIIWAYICDFPLPCPVSFSHWVGWTIFSRHCFRYNPIDVILKRVASENLRFLWGQAPKLWKSSSVVFLNLVYKCNKTPKRFDPRSPLSGYTATNVGGHALGW